MCLPGLSYVFSVGRAVTAFLGFFLCGGGWFVEGMGVVWWEGRWLGMVGGWWGDGFLWAGNGFCELLREIYFEDIKGGDYVYESIESQNEYSGCLIRRCE